MVTYLDLGRMGRLGNQMFEIASTIGIALKNDQEFSFPEWVCHHSMSDYSNIFVNRLPKLTINKNVVNVSENSFSYNDIILPKNDEIYCLKGYFQSEKYFENYKDTINYYFTLKPEIENFILNKYKNILPNSCSIHIRRGDYLKQVNHHPVQSLSYYHNAIETIYGKDIDDINFLIFSDDIKWCEENISLPKVYFIENNSNIIDMFLMSKCDNNIIANSSFSWWGAWLNKNENKKVISPLEWFGVNYSNLEVKDLIPKQWVKI